MAEYNGPIAPLEPAQQVNVVLFRLAKALGYTISKGKIHGDVDEVLNNAVTVIKNVKKKEIN